MAEQEKLERLTRIEGFGDSMDLLAASMFDSVSAGICTNADCDFTTTVEPDQSEGWCEECEDTTVSSALVLAGII